MGVHTNMSYIIFFISACSNQQVQFAPPKWGEKGKLFLHHPKNQENMKNNTRKTNPAKNKI